jgi:hypothetical protein
VRLCAFNDIDMFYNSKWRRGTACENSPSGSQWLADVHESAAIHPEKGSDT